MVKNYLLSLSSRNIYLFIFIFIGLIIGYAAYSIKNLGLEPCSLCISQQILYCLIGIIAFFAFMNNSSTKISPIYSYFIFIITLLGVWVSSRQIWLQGLPEDAVPACGASIEYILKTFPFKDLLLALFIGDGNCADIPWSFLGLSMAGWSLIFFSFLLLASCLVIVKANSIYK